MKRGWKSVYKVSSRAEADVKSRSYAWMYKTMTKITKRKISKGYEYTVWAWK